MKERRGVGKRKNGSERSFSKVMRGTPFDLNGSPSSIRCDPPVENKNGDMLKKVTQPDFEVINPETGESVYVEVTNGKGSGDHKNAQKRVADAAGVPYVVITGDDLKALESTEGSDKTTMLMSLFGWEQGY